MHRHWRLLTPALIAALVAGTYFATLAVSGSHDRQIADTGARIVADGCRQTNRVSAVTSAALVQQKRLSQQNFEAGKTTRAQWLVQQSALDTAIRGLAPRDCAAAAMRLRRSVR